MKSTLYRRLHPRMENEKVGQDNNQNAIVQFLVAGGLKEFYV